MPYVPVPKDLSKVKTKVAFNLTKRQLICFSLAAAVGVPIYFLTKGFLGNTVSVFLMIGFMLPFFFFAMYERNGQPAEKNAYEYHSSAQNPHQPHLPNQKSLSTYEPQGGFSYCPNSQSKKHNKKS